MIQGEASARAAFPNTRTGDLVTDLIHRGVFPGEQRDLYQPRYATSFDRSSPRRMVSDVMKTNSKIIRPALTALIAAVLLSAPYSHAKGRGTDDSAQHKAGDDLNRPGRAGNDDAANDRRGKDADDPANHDVGDDRGARGADDPADHDLGDDRGVRDADDPANHDAADDRGGATDDNGKGRGGHDEKPGHR